MTITSLTATTAAPLAAPKGAASPIQTQTVAPDAQAAAISSDAPTLSNAELAVAAARQSAAARQDGLAALMANLLRATAAGNLPSPVQSAVDQLMAFQLPTDVAPDAAAVKSALLTSGLFTEAVLAGNPSSAPLDIKTALLQLNTALEVWMTRTTLAADAPRAAAIPSPNAQTAASKTVPAAAPVAAPRVAEREPSRRTGTTARANEGAKLASAPTAPQRATSGKNQTPIETSPQTAPSDAAPDAETVKSAIRVLGQIAQAKASPDMPKEIKAVLVLLNNAIAQSNTAPEEAPSPVATTPQRSEPVTGQRAVPSTPISTPTQKAAASPVPVRPLLDAPQQDVMPEMPAAQPAVAQRVSSPVEQLLALQLAPDETVIIPTPAAVETAPATPEPVATIAKAVEGNAALAASPGSAQSALQSAQPAAAPLKSEVSAPQSAQPATAPSKSEVSAPPSNTTSAPAVPNDVKTLLTLFTRAAQTLLPTAAQPATPQSATPAAPQSASAPAVTTQPSPTAPPRTSSNTGTAPAPQQPNATAPAPDLAGVIAALSNAGLLPQATISSATGGVPNDLKTLLLLFNMAAESWLPRTAATPVDTHTPSVPPPIAGAPSKAQPAASPTLPQSADAATTATQLLKGTDAALARQTLLQIASLPDATPQSRTSDARWMFDVPLMTPQGAAVAQMIIERDSRNTNAERPMPVWRVRFAIDVEPLGPVQANLALSGDRTWVTITADRPESLDKLQSNASWLMDALQSTELTADIAFQPGNAGPANKGATRFVDHAS